MKFIIIATQIKFNYSLRTPLYNLSSSVIIIGVTVKLSVLRGFFWQNPIIHKYRHLKGV